MGNCTVSSPLPVIHAYQTSVARLIRRAVGRVAQGSSAEILNLCDSLFEKALYLIKTQTYSEDLIPLGILHIHSCLEAQFAGSNVLFALYTAQFLASSPKYVLSKNEETTCDR